MDKTRGRKSKVIMSIKRENAERVDYPNNPPMATPTAKKWWESTGFFTSGILFLLGFWGLNTADMDVVVKGVVMHVYSLVGILAGARIYFAKAKFDPKKWFSELKSYEYLVAALVPFIPRTIPDDLDDKLFGLANAIKSGNFGLIASQVFSLVVVLWNVWKSQPPKAPAATK